jgi:soluble lytic murein transglycosylase-like protein
LGNDPRNGESDRRNPMNSVILKDDYLKQIRKLKKRHWLIHLTGVLLTLAILTIPYLRKLDRDQIVQAYRVAKLEFDGVQTKQKILTILRSRGLTLGQGLDISDVILSQQEVPVSMVLAIMDTESSFNSDAVVFKGDRGFLQATPLTARTYAGNLSNNIHDPIVNIRASLGYLGDLKGIYDSWPKALRTYNGGPNNVDNKALNGYVQAIMAKAEVFANQLSR